MHGFKQNGRFCSLYEILGGTTGGYECEERWVRFCSLYEILKEVREMRFGRKVVRSFCSLYEIPIADTIVAFYDKIILVSVLFMRF